LYSGKGVRTLLFDEDGEIGLFVRRHRLIIQIVSAVIVLELALVA